jgi:hypothetical protein
LKHIGVVVCSFYRRDVMSARFFGLGSLGCKLKWVYIDVLATKVACECPLGVSTRSMLLAALVIKEILASLATVF